MKLIKILTTSSLLLTTLVATPTSDNMDTNIIKFEKERFSQNKRIENKKYKNQYKKTDAPRIMVWIYC